MFGLIEKLELYKNVKAVSGIINMMGIMKNVIKKHEEEPCVNLKVDYCDDKKR